MMALSMSMETLEPSLGTNLNLSTQIKLNKKSAEGEPLYKNGRIKNELGLRGGSELQGFIVALQTYCLEGG